MGTQTPKFKRMSEEEFAQIKALSKVGLNPAQIRVALGNNRSVGTISVAVRFPSLEAYRQHMRDDKARSLALLSKGTTPVIVNKRITPEALLPAQGLSQYSTARSLERMARALERLADAWEASPRKKGLFS